MLCKEVTGTNWEDSRGDLPRDESWGFTTDHSLFKSTLPPSALRWWRAGPICKHQLASPCALLPVVFCCPTEWAFCRSPFSSLRQKIKDKKGEDGYFFAKLRSWTRSQQEQGPAVRMSRAGKAEGEKDLLCVVAMSHLAGPLFVASSVQDAELLAHAAGDVHVPEEAQGRRVAWNPPFLCCFGVFLTKGCAWGHL